MYRLKVEKRNSSTAQLGFSQNDKTWNIIWKMKKEGEGRCQARETEI